MLTIFIKKISIFFLYLSIEHFSIKFLNKKYPNEIYRKFIIILFNNPLSISLIHLYINNILLSISPSLINEQIYNVCIILFIFSKSLYLNNKINDNIFCIHKTLL